MVNDLIARFGAAGAVALLNSQITSATAVAAGITPPYPNFTNPAVQTTRSVAQALRPFPQYATRQHHGQRRRQDRTIRCTTPAVLKLTQRTTDGLTFQGSYTYSQTDDQRRYLQRQLGLDGHGAARARVFDRPARSAAQHQAEHGLRAAVRTGPPLAA